MVYLLTAFLTYLLPYLFTPLRIGPFHFQFGDRKRRPNVALLFVYFVRFKFQSWAKWLAGKYVSKITYFVSSGA